MASSVLRKMLAVSIWMSTGAGWNRGKRAEQSEAESNALLETDNEVRHSPLGELLYGEVCLVECCACAVRMYVAWGIVRDLDPWKALLAQQH